MRSASLIMNGYRDAAAVMTRVHMMREAILAGGKSVKTRKFLRTIDVDLHRVLEDILFPWWAASTHVCGKNCRKIWGLSSAEAAGTACSMQLDCLMTNRRGEESWIGLEASLPGVVPGSTIAVPMKYISSGRPQGLYVDRGVLLRL